MFFSSFFSFLYCRGKVDHEPRRSRRCLCHISRLRQNQWEINGGQGCGLLKGIKVLEKNSQMVKRGASHKPSLPCCAFMWISGLTTVGSIKCLLMNLFVNCFPWGGIRFGRKIVFLETYFSTNSPAFAVIYLFIFLNCI